MAGCVVGGCPRAHHARGLCDSHYARKWRYGDPLVVRGVTPGTLLRWVQAVSQSDSDECLLWPFAPVSHGYGSLEVEGRPRKAHALAKILSGTPQPDPPNHHALHTCDTPPCCNPRHVYFGSQADNTADKVARERQHFPRGTKNGRALLTEESVRAIRQMAAEGHRVSEIARTLGAKNGTIYSVVHGRNWGWLT